MKRHWNPDRTKLESRLTKTPVWKNTRKNCWETPDCYKAGASYCPTHVWPHSKCKLITWKVEQLGWVEAKKNLVDRTQIPSVLHHHSSILASSLQHTHFISSIFISSVLTVLPQTSHVNSGQECLPRLTIFSGFRATKPLRVEGSWTDFLKLWTQRRSCCTRTTMQSRRCVLCQTHPYRYYWILIDISKLSLCFKSKVLDGG